MVEPTTPAARIRWLRVILLLAQPPLLDQGGELLLPRLTHRALHSFTALRVYFLSRPASNDGVSWGPLVYEVLFRKACNDTVRAIGGGFRFPVWIRTGTRSQREERRTQPVCR